MDSSMIGKIEKAMFYAHEPERIRFETFQATVQGDHHIHTVTYNRGQWHCDCKFYGIHRVCSHIMALERILGSAVQVAEATYVMDSGMINKIEKAIFYAQERDRIKFDRFSAAFQGDHKMHTVNYDHGQWCCDCSYFQHRGVCSHVMAMERLLIDSVATAEAIPMPA
ncbi:MAG TPA: SWIM zinc finger family protein [Anaerolineae bacterium]|nr:SWIM zinc finger family protein [Anaerolineae bacterium]HMR62529.1 SWIM zinc finger family protein [Anaerolineae bacterium]